MSTTRRARSVKGLDFEAPEVETIRRDLEREIVGRKIKGVEAASMKCLSRYRSRKAFATQLEGRKITDVWRMGLYLVIELNSGSGPDNESRLIVSLGSTGSPQRATNKAPTKPGTEIVISFTQYGQLRFVDPQGTGQMFVSTGLLKTALPEINDFGLDPVANQASWTDMGSIIRQLDSLLKPALTNDSFVVGIGNIYADEILFDAGLRFDRECKSLTPQEIRRLHRSLGGTMHEAMKYRGTSVPERPFYDAFGNPGNYGSHLKVWGKHGQLSERNRRPIQRQKFRGVWTYFCETQV